MKNLHLIATDKPSRLWTNNLRRRLEIDEFPEQHPTNIAKHIFITSDEKIKEGDWIYRRKSLYETIQKATFPLNLTSVNKKIILTIDQDLINDGIQAIDDEFLQWFVKNSSCEEVEVVRDKTIAYTEDRQRTFYGKYKIIIPREEHNPCKDIVINDKATIDVTFHNKHIRFENLTSEQAGYLIQVSEFYQLSSTKRSAVVPKEEPKQIKCYCGHTTYCDCGPLEEPKQETLEKGVDKYFKLSHSRLKNEQQKEYERELFIAGAKWQAERMYSEEDMLNFAWFLIENVGQYSCDRTAHFEGKYLEQFKKK